MFITQIVINIDVCISGFSWVQLSPKVRIFKISLIVHEITFHKESHKHFLFLISNYQTGLNHTQPYYRPLCVNCVMAILANTLHLVLVPLWTLKQPCICFSSFGELYTKVFNYSLSYSMWYSFIDNQERSANRTVC